MHVICQWALCLVFLKTAIYMVNTTAGKEFSTIGQQLFAATS
jgi:hypothetical protein